MKQCTRCYSQAINPHRHGRDNSDLDLCDVCFWRNRAERAAELLAAIMRGEVNPEDEAEKWLRAYAPELLNAKSSDPAA